MSKSPIPALPEPSNNGKNKQRETWGGSTKGKQKKADQDKLKTKCQGRMDTDTLIQQSRTKVVKHNSPKPSSPRPQSTMLDATGNKRKTRPRPKQAPNLQDKMATNAGKHSAKNAPIPTKGTRRTDRYPPMLGGHRHQLRGGSLYSCIVKVVASKETGDHRKLVPFKRIGTICSRSSSLSWYTFAPPEVMKPALQKEEPLQVLSVTLIYPPVSRKKAKGGFSASLQNVKVYGVSIRN